MILIQFELSLREKKAEKESIHKHPLFASQKNKFKLFFSTMKKKITFKWFSNHRSHSVKIAKSRLHQKYKPVVNKREIKNTHPTQK